MAQRGETVICEGCGEPFVVLNSEAEARAEQAANGWGGESDTDMAVVCEPCYRAWIGALTN